MLRPTEDRWLPTVCYMCYSCCGIKVHRIDDTIIEIKGDENNPHNLGKLCCKGKAALMSLYDPNRVKTPLRRTNPEKGIGIDPGWEPISWDEALEIIVEKLKKIKREDPRKLVLAGLDFQMFLIYWAFASAFGTPNVYKGAADYFCGNGLHPILYLTNASFFAEPDLEYCNYCILVGSQLGFMLNTNANTLTQKMAEARARGMKLIVVDPICTNAAAKADEWVPIRPGTDAAFVLGVTNLLVNELEVYDREFLLKYTNAPYLVGPDGCYLRNEAGKPLVWDVNAERAKPYDASDINEMALEGRHTVNQTTCQPAFQLLKERLRNYPPEKVSDITSVPADTIRRIAREFGENARVGSKIVVQGQPLPYRPVNAHWNRGPIAHKHGMLTGFAIQLLNIVVGAMDVPGGQLGSNPVGPFWSPKEGPDGLIVPADLQMLVEGAYPARAVERPQTLELRELFPVAPYSSPIFEDVVLNPEKYKIPYQPEMMFICESNVMMSTCHPKRMAEVLKKIPFIVTFSIQLDETAEFADLVLPDAHFLERLAPFPNHPAEWIAAGQGSWYWMFQQPVVSPAGQARPWGEVLLEIAGRLDILSDFYTILNSSLNFQEPHRLDKSKKYSWDEIADIWAKSWFGPDHGLDFFKEQGFYISAKKKVEEAYPRPFLKPRLPIYLEHFLEAGKEVQRVTQQLGLNWDTSDYQPLPDWKPCLSDGEGSSEFDLYAVNFKLPIHTFSTTTANPWLNELAERQALAYKVLLNGEVAQKLKIKDGDTVCVESKGGKAVAQAKVTECVHPEVVGIVGTFGHWARGMPLGRGQGVHFNGLIPGENLEMIDRVSAALDCCIRVKIYKA